MSLFNEYENKTIQYLISYINQAILGTLDAVNPDDFGLVLSGGSRQLTTEEVVKSILNKRTTENLNIFYSDEDTLITPIFHQKDPLAYLYSKYEREWLYMALSDPKADLFLDPDEKSRLLRALEQVGADTYGSAFVGTVSARTQAYNKDEIINFKEITFAVSGRRFVDITLTDGDEFSILPFKVIYDISLDSFSILAMDSATMDLRVVYFDDIKTAEKSGLSSYNADSYESTYRNLLKKHLVTEPVVIEVNDVNVSSKGIASSSLANDRTAHLFSDFNTTVYKNPAGNLVYEVSYYDFQKEKVIENLLSLGKYVKVISPDSFRNEFIDLLKHWC